MGVPPERQSGLSVRFEGRIVATLRPGRPPFTFGRAEDRSLTIGETEPDGTPSRHVSRHAGSIRWADGLWLVCNDSKTRPFDVLVGGVANPVHPRTSRDSRSVWAVGPRGVKIQVADPWRVYVLELLPEREVDLTDPDPDDGDGTTHPLRQLNERERLLLAAKFLALPEPGEAVGNREAAEYATATLEPGAQPVTEAMISGVVYRWTQELTSRGVQGVGGTGGIHNVGRQLLAWGVLNQGDRTLLRPWGRPDPTASTRAVRPVRPDDIAALSSALSRAVFHDPLVSWMIPDAARRTRVLPALLTLLAETFQPLGASLFAAAGGAVLWTPPGGPPFPDGELLRRIDQLAGTDAPRVRAALTLLEKHKPPSPSAHLRFWGVAPGRQGRGIGSTLLACGLDRCDRERQPVYVEATQTRSRACYERHGFTVIGQIAVSDGLSVWSMWREPDSDAAGS